MQDEGQVVVIYINTYKRPLVKPHNQIICFDVNGIQSSHETSLEEILFICNGSRHSQQITILISSELMVVTPSSAIAKSILRRILARSLSLDLLLQPICIPWSLTRAFLWFPQIPAMPKRFVSANKCDTFSICCKFG